MVTHCVLLSPPEQESAAICTPAVVRYGRPQVREVVEGAGTAGCSPGLFANNARSLITSKLTCACWHSVC